MVVPRYLNIYMSRICSGRPNIRTYLDVTDIVVTNPTGKYLDVTDIVVTGPR